MKNSPESEGKPKGRSLAEAPPSPLCQSMGDACPEMEFDLPTDLDLMPAKEAIVTELSGSYRRVMQKPMTEEVVNDISTPNTTDGWVVEGGVQSSQKPEEK